MGRRRKRIPESLTATQVKVLLEAIPVYETRDAAAIRLMVGCGLRIAEVSELQAQDVDLKERRVKVREGKGQKDRVVPMTGETAEVLARHLGGRQDGPVIMSNRRGAASIRQIRRIVKHWAEVAGLPAWVHPHTLRHSFAIACFRSGQKLPTIQYMLGHESLSTTQIYLRVYDKDIADDWDARPLEW